MNNRNIGKMGELMALEYLVSAGYTVLAQNHYIDGYEIDLIMEREGEIYFIEVKYRRNLKYGYPIEAMTRIKCQNFKRACMGYLRMNKITQKYHLAFLGILKIHNSHEIQWVKDFFT